MKARLFVVAKYAMLSDISHQLDKLHVMQTNQNMTLSYLKPKPETPRVQSKYTRHRRKTKTIPGTCATSFVTQKPQKTIVNMYGLQSSILLTNVYAMPVKAHCVRPICINMSVLGTRGKPAEPNIASIMCLTGQTCKCSRRLHWPSHMRAGNIVNQSFAQINTEKAVTTIICHANQQLVTHTMNFNLTTSKNHMTARLTEMSKRPCARGYTTVISLKSHLVAPYAIVYHRPHARN